MDLAFLLVKRGDNAGAEKHLQAFLAQPPSGEEAERWIRHAQATLEQMQQSNRRRDADCSGVTEG